MRMENTVDKFTQADNNHERFMALALRNAEAALAAGEFPVGCVIVKGETVISSSSRAESRMTDGGETRHAEIIALEMLEKDHPGVDRGEMVLYATMEPCLMCFAAIIISGIKKVVYAYEDVMGGGTACDLSILPPLYSDSGIKVISGVMRRESLDFFKKFFSDPSNGYLRDSLLARHTLETS